MLRLLLNFLSGACSHQQITFPMKKHGEILCHVACLDCSKDLPYSWDEMRILTEREAAQATGDFRLGQWIDQARINSAVERILAK